MNKNIKVFDYDLEGNKVNLKDFKVKDKVIYEIIKKYIKL